MVVGRGVATIAGARVVQGDPLPWDIHHGIGLATPIGMPQVIDQVAVMVPLGQGIG